MSIISIYLTYREDGEEYFFAKNSKSEYFQNTTEKGLKFVSEANSGTMFKALEELENLLNIYFDRLKKFNSKPKIIKTLEF
jgi:hypothetical protein